MQINQIKTFLLPRLEILKRKILGNAYIYKISNGVLDIFFPKICLNCQKEVDYLCLDCSSFLDILDFHQKYQTRNLADLYFALPYQNRLVKKLIQKFKYQPFIKELAQTLVSLIITHFQLSSNRTDFSGFLLIPVPLEKRRLKWRGFNQAEEIGKELSSCLKIPLLGNVLIKIKGTQPQVSLVGKERKESLKEGFLVKAQETIRNKKIILVDDVYTTGSTMEECARVLRQAGAKEIIGIVAARAKPEEDYLQNV